MRLQRQNLYQKVILPPTQKIPKSAPHIQAYPPHLKEARKSRFQTLYIQTKLHPPIMHDCNKTDTPLQFNSILLCKSSGTPDKHNALIPTKFYTGDTNPQLIHNLVIWFLQLHPSIWHINGCDDDSLGTLVVKCLLSQTWRLTQQPSPRLVSLLAPARLFQSLIPKWNNQKRLPKRREHHIHT